MSIERKLVRLWGIAGQDYGTAEVVLAGKGEWPPFTKIHGQVFRLTETGAYRAIPVVQLENPSFPAFTDE